MISFNTSEMFQGRCISVPSIALDGGSVADVLTVVEGPGLITCMVLEITESPDAACTMAWEADPTAGGSNVPIGTALDINGFDVGDFVYAECDGTVLVHADVDAGTALARGSIGNNGIVVPIGGIDFIMQNADPTAGIGALFVYYYPLTSGARIYA